MLAATVAKTKGSGGDGEGRQKEENAAKRRKLELTTQNMNSEIEHVMQAIAIAIPQFICGIPPPLIPPQPQTVARKYNTCMCKYGLSS